MKVWLPRIGGLFVLILFYNNSLNCALVQLNFFFVKYAGSTSAPSGFQISHSRFSTFSLFVAICSMSTAIEFRTDFSDGLGPWQKSPSGNWAAILDGHNKVAALTQAGEQPGGVRRPTGYLLLPHFNWTNYSFNLRAKTLEPASTVQRDVVLIFGYADTTHFYYTHISSDSDDEFHNIIMKADGTMRSVIDQQQQPEARVTNGWHGVRVEHDADGSIRVFVDDMGTPLMTADDSSYATGSVGFGCFDDRALFDDVLISGEAIAPSPTQRTNRSTRGIIPKISGSLVAGVVTDRGHRPVENSDSRLGAQSLRFRHAVLNDRSRTSRVSPIGRRRNCSRQQSGRHY